MKTGNATAGTVDIVHPARLLIFVSLFNHLKCCVCIRVMVIVYSRIQGQIHAVQENICSEWGYFGLRYQLPAVRQEEESIRVQSGRVSNRGKWTRRNTGRSRRDRDRDIIKGGSLVNQPFTRAVAAAATAAELCDRTNPTMFTARARTIHRRPFPDR